VSVVPRASEARNHGRRYPAVWRGVERTRADTGCKFRPGKKALEIYKGGPGGGEHAVRVEIRGVDDVSVFKS